MNYSYVGVDSYWYVFLRLFLKLYYYFTILPLLSAFISYLPNKKIVFFFFSFSLPDHFYPGIHISYPPYYSENGLCLLSWFLQLLQDIDFHVKIWR